MNTNLANFIAKMNSWGKERKPFLFVIDFEMNTPFLVPLEDAGKEDIFYSVPGQGNRKDHQYKQNPLLFEKRAVPYNTYQNAFQKVQREINLGNTFLLNLTFPTEIVINWSLKEIFDHSTAPYKLLFKDQFVTFSPECFVRISEGKIYSFPMKGTIDASVPEAEEVILQDVKEKAEHATIVDLIRNDLSMVSREVSVVKYRYLDTIETNTKKLIQVSSEVKGILDDSYLERLGSIICSLLPAGSISGAPKESTMRIIKEVETYQRGYYTGVFGIFDGQELNSGVMIRFIEKSGNQFYFKSGGGITINSEAEKEYQELIDKVYVTTN